MAIVELRELAEAAQKDYASEIVAGLVNNEIRDLQSEIDDSANIEFIELNSGRGWRIYRRTVMFVLFTVVHEMYPSSEVVSWSYREHLDRAFTISSTPMPTPTRS